MAIMHEPVYCPVCGAVIPRLQRPKGDLGTLYGDNSYLDWNGHEKACPGKKDSPSPPTQA